MHKPWFGLIAIAALAMVPAGVRAQVTMENSYLKLFFNETGELASTPGGNGVLFSPTSGGVGQEMIAKDPFPDEAWILRIPTSSGHILVRNGGLLDGYGLVVDGGSGDSLHRTFVMDLGEGNPMLRLTQTVSLTDGGGLSDKRAHFEISLENLTPDAIRGIGYVRQVNPRQGPVPALGTDNFLGTAIYPEGVAADSTIPGLDLADPDQRHLALGSTVEGAKVNATHWSPYPETGDLAADGYYELVGGTPVASGSPIFQSGTPNGVPYGLHMWLDDAVFGALDAGATKTVSFDYVFAGPQSVPEPGTLAFLGASVLGGLFLFRRRRTA